MQYNYLKTVKKFDEFVKLDQTIKQNWERFHNKEYSLVTLDDLIINSWHRCKQYGLNPYQKTPVPPVQGNSLKEKKEQNSAYLDATLTIIKGYFQDNCDLVWDITDSDGIVLETVANREYYKLAEHLNCIPGQNFSEETIGTNATGLALLHNQTVQVFAAEHFVQQFEPYVTSASPINDPFTGQLVGVLHMASDKNVVLAHDVSLLELKKNQIEQMLGERILKENIEIFKSVFDSFQDPYILFNNKGMILRCNDVAKHVLHAKVGASLKQVLESKLKIGTLDRNFLMGMQEPLRLKDGSEWKLVYHPYMREGNIYGGVAIFQKCRNLRQPPKKVDQPTRYQFSDILTKDPSMVKVIKLAKKAAYSEKTILINGETGTGKELIAHSIHSYGPNSNMPFIEVNCGAIPKELVASELFGYEGGAFTGARAKGMKGKFQLADKGTIFLDEIGDLPIEVQVYLLRVLEERMITPIGGSKPIPIQVRVIAATHKNLEKEVEEGRFREDLFHRLNVIPIRIPPLRERKNDIEQLTRYFLEQFKEGITPPTIDDEVIEVLTNYKWSGNIRQLKNVVQRMIFTSDDSRICLSDLPQELLCSPPSSNSESNDHHFVLKRNNKYSKKQIDKNTLIQTLEETKGNISETARMLNTTRVTIYKKINRFNLSYQ
ncbi:sigma-54-dependent Fis family transcriptional regulator [Alkalihalobacterium alkalinitrilicum]|uniref:sigma-54-dependent Fis family transcriptional regulator n=1 Tax=Alkalihalobacterium alkalinitrilicum TaxID=427920 RepID=UPI0009957C5C|nr:sigma-54-dependent Fis family transcriptional regulator [Alkalihalobacterium alkalinitrilicum]